MSLSHTRMLLKLSLIFCPISGFQSCVELKKDEITGKPTPNHIEQEKIPPTISANTNTKHKETPEPMVAFYGAVMTPLIINVQGEIKSPQEHSAIEVFTADANQHIIAVLADGDDKNISIITEIPVKDKKFNIIDTNIKDKLVTRNEAIYIRLKDKKQIVKKLDCKTENASHTCVSTNFILDVDVDDIYPVMMYGVLPPILSKEISLKGRHQDIDPTSTVNLFCQNTEIATKVPLFTKNSTFEWVGQGKCETEIFMVVNDSKNKKVLETTIQDKTPDDKLFINHEVLIKPNGKTIDEPVASKYGVPSCGMEVDIKGEIKTSNNNVTKLNVSLEAGDAKEDIGEINVINKKFTIKTADVKSTNISSCTDYKMIVKIKDKEYIKQEIIAKKEGMMYKYISSNFIIDDSDTGVAIYGLPPP